MLNGREVSFYASFLGSVVLTIVLNPQLAHAGPVDDRWPNEITAPSALEAASFLNAWDLVKSGADIVAPHDDLPAPPLARADATIRCARTPDTSTSHWMWREVDGRQCWYVGTMLVPKSRLRWPISGQVD
jgi:hypothetical protein